jgi:hypothetical protein
MGMSRPNKSKEAHFVFAHRHCLLELLMDSVHTFLTDIVQRVHSPACVCLQHTPSFSAYCHPQRYTLCRSGMNCHFLASLCWEMSVYRIVVEVWVKRKEFVSSRQ